MIETGRRSMDSRPERTWESTGLLLQRALRPPRVSTLWKGIGDETAVAGGKGGNRDGRGGRDLTTYDRQRKELVCKLSEETKKSIVKKF